MVSTTRAGIPYPTPDDANDVPRDLERLADRVAELVGATPMTGVERDALEGADLYPGRAVWVTDSDPPGLEVYTAGDGWVRAGITRHDALDGLDEGDPHPQYVPADGSRPVTGNLTADAAVTVTGTLTVAALREQRTTTGSSTPTIDLDGAAVQQLTHDGPIDVSWAGVPTDPAHARSVTIVVASSDDVSWPAETRFPGGEPPKLDPEAWLVAVAADGHVTVHPSGMEVSS